MPYDVATQGERRKPENKDSRERLEILKRVAKDAARTAIKEVQAEEEAEEPQRRRRKPPNEGGGKFSWF